MRNCIRDSLVDAFTREMVAAGLSQRNAFLFANEKYLALKKLYWLPNQQHVGGSDIPKNPEPHRCRSSTRSRSQTSKRRLSTATTGKTTPLCRGRTSACTASVVTSLSTSGTGRMNRLEQLEDCLEISAFVCSLLRCLRGLTGGVADAAVLRSTGEVVGEGRARAGGGRGGPRAAEGVDAAGHTAKEGEDVQSSGADAKQVQTVAVAAASSAWRVLPSTTSYQGLEI